LNNEVLLSELGEGIYLVTLNKDLNVLSTSLLNNLIGKLRLLSEQKDARVVILTGSKKAFIAGGDLKEFFSMTPKKFLDYSSLLIGVGKLIIESSFIVIAAVNGVAYGGGTYVTACCDIVIASETASFGQQEINVGLFGGASWLIPLIGLRKATELVLRGKAISAEEAKAIGLINCVVPNGKLIDIALEWAREIIEKSKLSTILAKRMLRATLNLPFNEALAREMELISLCFDTPDVANRIENFLTNRGSKTD
jgi:enoyl-CoA hydratase